MMSGCAFSDPEAARAWNKERADMIRAAKPVRPDMAQMDSEDDRDRMDLMMLRARRVVRERRKASPPAPLPRRTWRDVSRMEIPEYLIRQALRSIGRAFAWLAGPLWRAGPAIHLRLTQHLERLDDMGIDPADLSGLAAWKRSTALWLTQSPNDARRATLEETSDEAWSEPMSDPSTGAATGSSTPSERAS